MRRIRSRSDRANGCFREQNVTDHSDLPVQTRVRARDRELRNPVDLSVHYASEKNDVAILSKSGNKIERIHLLCVKNFLSFLILSLITNLKKNCTTVFQFF